MACDSSSQPIVEMRWTPTDMASCTLLRRKEMDTLHYIALHCKKDGKGGEHFSTAVNCGEKEGEGEGHFALHCSLGHSAQCTVVRRKEENTWTGAGRRCRHQTPTLLSPSSSLPLFPPFPTIKPSSHLGAKYFLLFLFSSFVDTPVLIESSFDFV